MSSEKVLSYGDCIVRKSDVRLLTTKQWLNDTLISFYFQYLQNQLGSEVLFVTPEVTQLLKLNLHSAEEISAYLPQQLSRLMKIVEGIENGKRILFAVNDSTDLERHSGGSHWSLLIYSKIDNSFIHFDSLGGENSTDGKILAKKLSPFTSNAEFVNSKNCKCQENSYDCGCHVLANANLISEYCLGDSNSKVSLLDAKVPTAGPKEAAEMRENLNELIKKLANDGNSY